MRIALVYDAIYPFVTGGGEKRNWEIAYRLAARGHDITLVGMQSWPGPSTITRENVTCVGVHPWLPHFTPSGGRSFKQPLQFTLGAYRHLRRNHYDLVDCAGWPLISCVASRVALPRRVPLVITWFEVRGLRGWLRDSGVPGLVAYFCEQLAGRMTRHNVVISALTRQQACRTFCIPEATCRVIPCGVDYARMKAPPGNERRDEILYVGRLVSHKRVDLLFRGFHRICREFPSVTLQLVGTGHEDGPLRALAQKLGIQDRVVFRGTISEAELTLAYRRARTFVLPSAQEGFGIVLVEAMAAGAVVLALEAERSAAAEVIQDGVNGLLFRDEESLAQALGRVFSDSAAALRLSGAGVQTAAEYDWERVVDQVEAYYLELASVH